MQPLTESLHLKIKQLEHDLRSTRKENERLSTLCEITEAKLGERLRAASLEIEKLKSELGKTAIAR
jgi:hypothetical protein